MSVIDYFFTIVMSWQYFRDVTFAVEWRAVVVIARDERDVNVSRL